MTSDAIIRAVAALAAVVLVSGPAAAAVVRRLADWRPATPAEASEDGIGLAEMRVVLDLAARLRRIGCVDGVALCQQLLDVMLAPKAAKK